MEYIVDIVLSILRHSNNRQQKRFLDKSDKEIKIELLEKNIYNLQGYLLIMALTDILFIYLLLAIGIDTSMLIVTILYIFITMISIYSLRVDKKNLQELKKYTNQ